MKNAQQLSASLGKGKTGVDIIKQLHTMSPQDQKATLTAMQQKYPAAWKAYQQAKGKDGTAAPGQVAPGQNAKAGARPAANPQVAGMRNAMQFSASLGKGKTSGTEMINQLHTMSPQEQQATLAAMQRKYPDAWKAYQQAKAQGQAGASGTTIQGTARLEWAKTFTNEFVRGLKQDTTMRLGQIKDGAERSLKETLQGLAAIAQHPELLVQGAKQQVADTNRRMLANVALALMASGVIGKDPKAAQQAISKMTAKEWNDTTKALGDILSDSEKISYYTTGALTAVATDGALGAVSKGAGTLARGALNTTTGQRVAAGAAGAATRINQGLDNVTTTLFPGGPKGPGGLAVAAGGTVGNTLARTGGGGLNLGPVPKGLAGAGAVGTSNLMAGKGTGGTPALPDSDWSPESVDGRVADGRVARKTQPITYLQGQKVDVLGKQVKLDVDLAPTISNIKTGVKTYSQDGKVYNGSGLAPRPKGYYQEYVVPTSGVNGAGSQRIVVGRGGEMYYTPDHYDSFIKLMPNK